jgi:hypothetical protein
MPNLNKAISRLLIYLAILAGPIQGLPAATCGCGGSNLFSNASCTCCGATTKSEGGCCCSTRQQNGPTSCCSKSKREKDTTCGRAANCGCGANCQCGKSRSIPPATPAIGNHDAEQLVAEDLSTVTTATVRIFPSVMTQVADGWDSLPATALERCTSLCRFTL